MHINVPLVFSSSADYSDSIVSIGRLSTSDMPFIPVQFIEIFGVNEGVSALCKWDSSKDVAIAQSAINKGKLNAKVVNTLMDINGKWKCRAETRYCNFPPEISVSRIAYSVLRFRIMSCDLLTGLSCCLLIRPRPAGLVPLKRRGGYEWNDLAPSGATPVGYLPNHAGIIPYF